MKFLLLFLISFSVAAKGPLSNVPKDILAEERLQAANDFSDDFEAECTAATLSAEDCAQLRSFTKTQRYNAKLSLYSHMESLADKRALARHGENECVRKMRVYFTQKGYPFSQADNCAAFSAALLVHEPPEK